MEPFFIIIGILFVIGLIVFAVRYSSKSRKKVGEGRSGGEHAHQEIGDAPGDPSPTIVKQSQQQHRSEAQPSSHHHGGFAGGHHSGGFDGGHHSGGGFDGGGGGGHGH